MPGTHVKTIQRFIDRLNKAVSRSALLRVSIRSSGGRMLDIARLADLDRAAPKAVLRAFVGSPESDSRAKDSPRAGDRRAARLDLDPPRRRSPVDRLATSVDDELDEESQPTRYEALLSSIRRGAELAKRETGVHALWFGWPLLHVSNSEDEDAQSVLAPLFMFAASITPDSNRRSITTIARNDEIGPPRWNPALGAWLEQKLGIRIEPPSEDEVRQWSFEDFAAWIDRSVSAFPVPPRLDTAELVRVPVGSQLRPSVEPRLINAGALGLYRWQNAAVLADLLAIKSADDCPDPLDSLLAGRTFDEPRPAPPSEAERYLVTDADFSQAQVVWKIRGAEGLVMHGPPGTGKSQTIVNVIADSLARGERVLMVCQKDAATRVVHNRLRQAGLEGLCLEVHDAETDRLTIFRAIRDQVETLPHEARALPRDRPDLARRIESLESELDQFAIGLRQADPRIGISYRDLLALEGRSLRRLPGARPLPTPPRSIEDLDHESARSIAGAIRRLGELFHAARVPGNPWVDRLRDVEHQTGFRQDAEQLLAVLRSAAESLDAAVAAIRSHDATTALPPLEGDLIAWSAGLGRILDRCRSLVDRPLKDREVIRGWLRWLEQPGAAPAPVLTSLVEATKVVAASDECPRDPAWSAVLTGSTQERLQAVFEACRRVLASTSESWLRRWLSRSLKEARKVLVALRPDAVGTLLVEAARSGVRHADAIERERAVLAAAETCHPTMGRRSDDLATARQLIRSIHETAAEAFAIRDALRQAPMLAGVVDGVLTGRPLSPADEALVAAHRRRAEAVAACLPTIEGLGSLFTPEVIERLRKEARGDGTVRAWADRAICDLDRIDALAAWEAELRGVDQTWRPVVNQLSAWGLDRWSDAEESARWGERWEVVFLLTMIKEWRSRLFARHPVLMKITPPKQEAMAKELGALLDKKRGLEAKAIIASWTGKQIESRPACPWEAVFKLKASKNGPSLRLREAVAASAESGLLDMRPCWLTNPAAVSQIFPLVEGLFDLVIFDEASQCPTEQALPAIYRARRVLVAGDQKQLPPTSFFSSSSDEELDAEHDAAAEDEPVQVRAASTIARFRRDAIAESTDLLEAAVGSLPQTYLQVHYRSEHPDLIQFSNHAFYGGRLEAPPTARPRDAAPPIVFKDAGGTYVDRTNPVEATRVVEEIAALITLPNPPTIGVVTFNQPQRELVEDLIDERMEQDAVFRDAYSREASRVDGDLDVGLFVKNLENVQGDERDVMIFSTTFGRDAERKFFRRFGPVGQIGGERRLNVAVTRAKRRVIVVSSMPISEVSPILGDLRGSGDIPPSGYLQLYLDYAKSTSERDRAQSERVLARLGRRRGERTLEGPESPFEEEVLLALGRLGVEAEPQVGDGGFRIDIAIPHEDRSRGYALAIECDGAAYHSDRSARIRDVWRQGVLEQRGWRIHRIWSRAWWDNQSKEIERLAEAVRAALDR